MSFLDVGDLLDAVCEGKADKGKERATYQPYDPPRQRPTPQDRQAASILAARFDAFGAPRDPQTRGQASGSTSAAPSAVSGVPEVERHPQQTRPVTQRQHQALMAAMKGKPRQQPTGPRPGTHTVPRPQQQPRPQTVQSHSVEHATEQLARWTSILVDPSKQEQHANATQQVGIWANILQQAQNQRGRQPPTPIRGEQIDLRDVSEKNFAYLVLWGMLTPGQRQGAKLWFETPETLLTGERALHIWKWIENLPDEEKIVYVKEWNEWARLPHSKMREIQQRAVWFTNTLANIETPARDPISGEEISDKLFYVLYVWSKLVYNNPQHPHPNYSFYAGTDNVGIVWAYAALWTWMISRKTEAERTRIQTEMREKIGRIRPDLLKNNAEKNFAYLVIWGMLTAEERRGAELWFLKDAKEISVGRAIYLWNIVKDWNLDRKQRYIQDVNWVNQHSNSKMTKKPALARWFTKSLDTRNPNMHTDISGSSDIPGGETPKEMYDHLSRWMRLSNTDPRRPHPNYSDSVDFQTWGVVWAYCALWRWTLLKKPQEDLVRIARQLIGTFDSERQLPTQPQNMARPQAPTQPQNMARPQAHAAPKSGIEQIIHSFNVLKSQGILAAVSLPGDLPASLKQEAHAFASSLQRLLEGVPDYSTRGWEQHHLQQVEQVLKKIYQILVVAPPSLGVLFREKTSSNLIRILPRIRDDKRTEILNWFMETVPTTNVYPMKLEALSEMIHIVFPFQFASRVSSNGRSKISLQEALDEDGIFQDMFSKLKELDIAGAVDLVTNLIIPHLQAYVWQRHYDPDAYKQYFSLHRALFFKDGLAVTGAQTKQQLKKYTGVAGSLAALNPASLKCLRSIVKNCKIGTEQFDVETTVRIMVLDDTYSMLDGNKRAIMKSIMNVLPPKPKE